MALDADLAHPVAVALIVGAAGLLVLLWRRNKKTVSAAPAQGPLLLDGFPADGVFTLDTLAQFDGTRLPLCLSCCGRVVDCSSSDNIKHGEGYGKLWAGQDATYALATASLKPEDAGRQDFKLEDFSAEQHKSLSGFFKHFTTKYPVVGTLKEHEGIDWTSVEEEAKDQTPFASSTGGNATEDAAAAPEPAAEGTPVMFSSGDRVAIQGLTAKPELNGATGILGKFVPEKNRFTVNLDTAETPMLFKPENLKKL